MKSHLPSGGKTERVLNRIYRHSGIDTRHSVIGDYAPVGIGREHIGDHSTRTPGSERDPNAGEGIFFDPQQGRFLSPGTGARNELYTHEARSLFSRVAAACMDHSTFSKQDVTHVITVSCTGFFAPGPDYYVVRDLGLRPETERVHIGFMGCYAAFTALRMARAICALVPDAVVLIVSVELCTLHLEPSEVLDNIIACSVFADGAAAAVVSSRERPRAGRSLIIDELASTIAPDSEADMAWTIGDRGFEMVLSTYVPRILEANVAGMVGDLLGRSAIHPSDVDHWAIHPGGRAILDKIGKALSLPEKALDTPRQVLRENGNMSSATIFFVLNAMMCDPDVGKGDRLCALAFGPGLTVESGLLTRA